MYGAAMSLQQFYYTYFSRSRDPKIRIPKSVDAWFSNPTTDLEREIEALIDQWNADQTSSLEQELFKQRKRLADAERTLQTKTTKKAQEDQRIAGNKIELARGKLSDLRRTEFVDSDARLFPGWYAPVMIVEDGHYVVKPMRFRYRFPGWNDAIEREKDGSYNARMDNIATKWRGAFGHRHGILMANRFYENVSRHAVEGRELRPARKRKTLFSNSIRSHGKTCWSRAYGRWASATTAARCTRSPLSRPIHRPRSRLSVTIAASSRSSPRTSAHGCIRIRTT